MARTAVSVVLGGKAQVCCIHDRQKRQVTTEAQVAALGLQIGIVYDEKQHKLQRCACCENLFFDPTDEPRYCRVCQRSFIHTPGGPLLLPEGVIE